MAFGKIDRCGVSMIALMLPVVFAGAAVAADIPEIVVTGRATQPLDVPMAVSKTNTPIGDLPRSVQIVPSELMAEQGDLRLTDVLNNVSGATQGGQFAFGFFDRVIIRGLNATYLTDGLPDQPSELTGIPHSLTGVERVEVLKGPGSALYGDGEQGGTINLVHFKPSDKFGANVSEQYGSFDTTSTTVGITGPTGAANVDYRLDANYTDSSGFRHAGSTFAEFLPALSWRPENHDVEARLEVREITSTPDASGIPFSPPTGTGLPAPVAQTNTYYTPFAKGDQDIARLLLSDAWTLDDDITINNRLSYTNRTVDVLRNAGGSIALMGTTYGLRSRQLREQHDHMDDVLYQLEPNFRFTTGGITHNLVTGVQFEAIQDHTTRATADLPNITDITNPVITDPALSTLNFLCDGTHSCSNADLWARFYSVYAVDQIDVTQSFKLRFSARGDSFHTAGVADANIPVNAGMEQPCSPPQKGVECQWLPGVQVGRTDNLFSWDAGAVYFFVPEFSAFVGASNAHYAVFNTEEPESVGSVPEGGTEVEGGLRLAVARQLTLTTSVYQVRRNSIFTVFADPTTGNDVPTVFSYRVRGWEGDLNATPIEHWTLNANFSWQTPVIVGYPQTPADLGKDVPSVPRVLANVWSDYDIPMADNTLRLKIGMRYRDHAFGDAGNTRIIPGATLFDTGFDVIHGLYVLSFGVNNFTDKQNWYGGAGTGGGALPGPGRTLFARISAKFQ